MFGQGSFVSLPGAGGQVRLAQAPTFPPAPPAPAPAPQPVLAPPVVVAPPVVTVPADTYTGLSHGAQVAIGAGVLFLSVLGLFYLTE